MEQFLSSADYDLIIRLVVATVLGLIIGTEREIARKTAGMRTYALTALGSALFIVISNEVVGQFTGLTNFDPLRVGAQVVAGLGFLCAGIIFTREAKVKGLTTAAGIWVTGGVGMAAGFGLYTIAISATVITLFVFTALWYVEQALKKITGVTQDEE